MSTYLFKMIEFGLQMCVNLTLTTEPQCRRSTRIRRHSCEVEFIRTWGCTYTGQVIHTESADQAKMHWECNFLLPHDASQPHVFLELFNLQSLRRCTNDLSACFFAPRIFNHTCDKRQRHMVNQCCTLSLLERHPHTMQEMNAGTSFFGQSPFEFVKTGGAIPSKASRGSLLMTWKPKKMSINHFSKSKSGISEGLAVTSQGLSRPL